MWRVLRIGFGNRKCIGKVHPGPVERVGDLEVSGPEVVTERLIVVDPYHDYELRRPDLAPCSEEPIVGVSFTVNTSYQLLINKLQDYTSTSLDMQLPLAPGVRLAFGIISEKPAPYAEHRLGVLTHYLDIPCHYHVGEPQCPCAAITVEAGAGIKLGVQPIRDDLTRVTAACHLSAAVPYFDHLLAALAEDYPEVAQHRILSPFPVQEHINPTVVIMVNDERAEHVAVFVDQFLGQLSGQVLLVSQGVNVRLVHGFALHQEERASGERAWWTGLQLSEGSGPHLQAVAVEAGQVGRDCKVIIRSFVPRQPIRQRIVSPLMAELYRLWPGTRLLESAAEEQPAPKQIEVAHKLPDSGQPLRNARPGRPIGAATGYDRQTKAEIVAKVLELRRNGISWSNIGKQFSPSVDTLQRWVKELAK